jgi:hypothetical protein
MNAEQLWLTHKHGCWHCQREAKHFEDGEMTCQEGVDLLIAFRHDAYEQAALFDATSTA